MHHPDHPDAGTCETCYYWGRDDDDPEWGRCAAEYTGDITTPTWADSWCEDYTPRNPKPEAK